MPEVVHVQAIMVVLFIAGLLFAAAVSAISLRHKLRRREEANRIRQSEKEFHSSFGVWPSSNHGSMSEERWRRGVQEVIDSILRERAFAFHKACEIQNKAIRENSNPLALSAPGVVGKQARLALDDASREVEIAKSSFWTAHRLAEKFGYEVKSSYYDYIK